MSQENSTFKPGEKVLAYHGPLVYEAKVLKYHESGSEVVQGEEENTETLSQNRIPAFLLDRNAYFLHYKGWNPKWDEWVPSERIIAFSEDNLGLSRGSRNARQKPVERLDSGKEAQAEAEAAEQKLRRAMRKKEASSESSSRRSTGDFIKEQAKANGAGKKRQKIEVQAGNSGKAVNTGNIGNTGITVNTGKTGNTGNTGKNGNIGNTGYTKNTGHTGYEVSLPFSPKLKCVLVDDWELITKDRKLVDPESITSVAKILNLYVEWKRERQNKDAMRSILEAMGGLRVLFDQTFGLDVLYKFERLQYSELLRKTPKFEASSMYGLEHLLRLLVTLPGRVAQTPMDAISVNIMMGHMRDLLNYIDDNLATLGSSYMNVSSQYDRVARV